jgi:hypothetical protein
MRYFERQVLTWVVVGTLLTGCVSIDRRIDDEAVDRLASLHMSGTFFNRSNRRSTDGDVTTLARLLFGIESGGPADAETVSISLDEDRLSVDFINQKANTYSKVYKRQDLSIGEDGKIELPTDRAFGGDAALIGYRTRTVTLFVNREGDLVAVHAGGGAGTLAIVLPIVVYGRHMAIFPRQR